MCVHWATFDNLLLNSICEIDLSKNSITSRSNKLNVGFQDRNHVHWSYNEQLISILLEVTTRTYLRKDTIIVLNFFLNKCITTLCRLWHKNWEYSNHVTYSNVRFDFFLLCSTATRLHISITQHKNKIIRRVFLRDTFKDSQTCFQSGHSENFMWKGILIGKR